MNIIDEFFTKSIKSTLLLKKTGVFYIRVIIWKVPDIISGVA